MRFRLDEVVNLLLAGVIGGLGLVRHGSAYFINVTGALGIFFIAYGWLRRRIPDGARASALGVAWGWLAISDGLLDRLWVTTAIGMLAIIAWLSPAFGQRQEDAAGRPADPAGRPQDSSGRGDDEPHPDGDKDDKDDKNDKKE